MIESASRGPRLKAPAIRCHKRPTGFRAITQATGWACQSNSGVPSIIHPGVRHSLTEHHYVARSGEQVEAGRIFSVLETRVLTGGIQPASASPARIEANPAQGSSFRVRRAILGSQVPAYH